MIGLLGSCSAKKNTAATRKYQAFITRYNIYYNGNEHYKETLGEMEKKYEDDYTTLLYPHPAEAKSNPKAPQPSGDFTRSIEKAQKAIQLRSIKKRPKRKSGKASDEYKKWLKREEFNPFLHNAWMMMGRSQYLNGDFSGAAATFFYISRHFSWLPETVTEAQLWQARSYVAFDWVNEAEAVFKRIKPAQLTNSTLRELYDFVEADIAVKRKDYAAAIPALQRAIKGAKGAQKTRLQYLLGQCLARQGRREEAFKAFKAAAEGGGTTYRTKLNARIAQSEVYSGKDITPEVKALKRMAGLDRNKKYLDQIYYAIGNLYLSRGDTLHAIENYLLASEKSERNGIEKAINDATLGQLYYEQGKYDLAQPPLSSAVPMLPETYPDYQQLKRRSDVLDELSVYAHNVALQDSLLRLSEKPEEEQLKIINKIIDELKKKEKEEEEAARRAEHEAEANASSAANNNPNAPTQFQMGSTDDSWYFYNTAVVASGRTEFQRRWGSRKLEDDWRRRNKSSFSFNDFDESSDSSDLSDSSESSENSDGSENQEAADPEAAKKAADPHYPEYYLAQIPKTEQDKQTAHEVIQEGLYSMGSILKDKLEDFPAARKEWNRLLEDYPDNVYRLDVYYNLYIMLMRLGQTAEAEHWRQLIISDFPDSKYGVALLDPDYIQRLREMPEAQRMMYEQAYGAYLANNNAQVHHSYQEMMKKYPVSEAMPKFMFLHALAYVTERKPDEFNQTLRELLERYPDTDLTPMASAYLKGMAQGRKLNEGVSNNRSMLWDIRLGSLPEGEEGAEGEGAEAEFIFDEDEPQYLALVYPTDKVNANLLLYNIARHNFNSFMVRDYDLEPLNYGQLGMLLIKTFDSLADAEEYRTMLGRSEIATLPEEVTPIIISAHNFQQLISSGSSFEQYFRAAAAALDPESEESPASESDSESESDPEPEELPAEP
ncbi:MAG: tetratricopeptide repeat protein [Bacteroidales bacterium]|nr:tetratricopeptide repeat protein [Bacteroidales bacterium]